VPTLNKNSLKIPKGVTRNRKAKDR